LIVGKQFDEAPAHLAFAVQARPGDPDMVALAEKACAMTGRKNAVYLDILAAAYAGAGRLTDAARVAREASALAAAEGRKELAAQIDARRKAYEAGQMPVRTP
jgi:hypothetical protein